MFHAGVFVVAAGWVHTAQILWNSQIRPTALGKYLTDHTFTACQVVLKKEIIDEVREEASKNPHNNVDSDPLSLPIPMNDPPPHLYIPVSEGRPWHSQIFREAFQFDPLAPSVDSRLIVDLKWFGMIHPNEYNQMTFEDKIKDRLGLPQPTFEFMLSADDKDREHQMFLDMQEVAFVLGDYLRGSEPRRIALGASTHTMGATRMGDKDDGTSVVDSHSKVWGFDNLYLGGNCVIPTANASNPTLTSVALAIRAVTHIMTSQTNSKLVGLTNNIQK